ncbi:MAG: hypothetical protein ACYDBJ_29570 [Aggregatilineales bacterium]
MGPHLDTIGLYWKPSNAFYLANTNTANPPYQAVQLGFGSTFTTPVAAAGDWSGAGVDGVGLFDQSNGLFNLCNSDSSCPTANESLVLGNPNDQPLAGHWLSTAPTFGVGVFRPSNGLIYLKNALTTGFADYTMVLGIPGDQGLAGDWDGDSVDSPGVYRPSTGWFYLSNQVCNCSVFGDYQLQLGNANGGYVPLAGDWPYPAQTTDGVGLYQINNSMYFLKNQLTTGFADAQFAFGGVGGQPVAGHWSGDAPPVAPRLSAPPNVLVPSTPVPVSPGSGNGQSGLGD